MEPKLVEPEEKIEEVVDVKKKVETSVKPKQEKKPKAHISDVKKKIVKDLAELMKKRTVMIVSIKNLPSAQFQEIKKKLRGRGVIQVAKKNLVDFALDHSGRKELHELVPFVDADTALLFSEDDAFEISGFLASNKTPAKAKIGQEAPEDIEIKAGVTDLLPGPDISALSAVGLQPKVEGGKIAIMNDAILVKKGEAINAAKASILAKLDITPFSIGLEPIAAFYDGKVYKDIKIDREASLEELKDAFGRALAFAVELDYVTGDTLTYILGKAVAHEGAISGLVGGEEKVEEGGKASAEGASDGEEKKEEVKAEETKPEEDSN